MNCGLKPEEFWNMTFVDYLRWVIYIQKKEAGEWDKVRTVMSYILNTQVEKKHQKKPKDIIPLWIDKLRLLSFKADKSKIPTEEEKERMLRNGR
jgi:hypothetical protein